jgi:CO dehydrogenase/acetyl-CoA synthase beta subunit
MSPTFFSTSKSEEEEEEEDKEEDKEEEVKKKKKTMTLIKVKNVLIIAAFVGHTNNPSGVSSSSRRSLFLSLLLLKS